MGIKASASVTIADISDGTDGTGISGTAVEYQAGSSGTTAPTGTWSTTVPATSASAPYLWTRVTYTYTDGSTPKVVYSVGSTPEGIVVGGRNLALNSGTEVSKTFTEYTNTTQSAIDISSYCKDGSRLTGKTVIISYDVYLDNVTFGTTNCWIGFNYKLVSGGSTYCASGETYIIKTLEQGKWHRISNKLPYTIKENYTFGSTTLYFRDFIGTIKIKNLKLEIGNKATDWTPAPEDVEEGINKAQTSADNAQNSANTAIDKANNAQASADEANATLLDWCYNNNKVYINGSKIYAGTVSATQIAAKAVTADKLSVSTLSAITADLGSVTAGSINIGNGKFVVDSSGNLTSQYIVATGGKIGCWTLGSNRMYDDSNSAGYVGVNKYGSGQAFWAGGTDLTGGSAPFRVGHSGTLVATNATISGNITASGGKIGCFNIDSDSMYTIYDTLTNTNNYSNVYLGSNGIGFGKSYLNSNGGAAFNAWDGTGSAIEGNSMYFYNGEVANVQILGTSGLVVAHGEVRAGIGSANAFRAVYGNYGFIIRNDGVNSYLMTTASGDPYGAWNTYIVIANSDCSTTFPAKITISSGDLIVNNGWIYLKNGMRLRTYNSSGVGANLIHWNSDNRIYIGEVTTKATKIRICQTCSNIGVLNSSGSWVTITTGVSDIREKNSIEDLQKSKEIIMGLKPKRFKFNDPEDDRYHLGFIAQDVRKTLDATIGDCAILEYNNTDPEELRPVNRNDESTFTYSMRYNEIIPAHVGLTQEHEYRIESMDNKIENLQTLLMEALDKIAAQEKLIEQLQTS